MLPPINRGSPEVSPPFAVFSHNPPNILPSMDTSRPFLRCRIVLLFSLVCLGASPAITAGLNPPGFPPFPTGHYQPAGLGPKVAKIIITTPASAANRGIMNGSAVVSVSVDADGKATDYLVIGYTDAVFGPALLEEAKTLTYQAAKFNGVAVPARYDLGYVFAPNLTRVEVSMQDAVRLQADKDCGRCREGPSPGEAEADH